MQINIYYKTRILDSYSLIPRVLYSHLGLIHRSYTFHQHHCCQMSSNGMLKCSVEHRIWRFAQKLPRLFLLFFKSSEKVDLQLKDMLSLEHGTSEFQSVAFCTLSLLKGLRYLKYKPKIYVTLSLPIIFHELKPKERSLWNERVNDLLPTHSLDNGNYTISLLTLPTLGWDKGKFFFSPEASVSWTMSVSPSIVPYTDKFASLTSSSVCHSFLPLLLSCLFSDTGYSIHELWQSLPFLTSCSH